jgi:hypothetical protein
LVVVGAWLLIFALTIGAFAIGSNIDSGAKAETSIPDSAASRALDVMNEEFPTEESSTQSLQLVFAPTQGAVTDAGVTSKIDAVLADAADLPGVKSVSNPFDATRPYISEDQSIAVATIIYGDLSAEQQKDYYAAGPGEARILRWPMVQTAGRSRSHPRRTKALPSRESQRSCHDWSSHAEGSPWSMSPAYVHRIRKRANTSPLQQEYVRSYFWVTDVHSAVRRRSVDVPLSGTVTRRITELIRRSCRRGWCDGGRAVFRR